MSGPLFNDLVLELSLHYDVVLYSGHRDLRKIEKINNNPWINLKKTIEYNNSSILSRIRSSIVYLFQITPSLVVGAKGIKVLVSNPPILGMYFAFFNMIKRAPFIIFVYDIYPEVVVQKGLLKENNVIIKIWRRINNYLYSHAKLIFTLSNSMRDILIQRSPGWGKKVYVTFPWINNDLLGPIKKNENPYLDQFTKIENFNILYSGNLGNSHEFGTLLGAALLLKGYHRIKFLFIGNGSKKQEISDFKTTHSLDNIGIYDLQANDVYPYTLALADISIVTVEEKLEDLMIPSKLFSYLAVGSPVIAIANLLGELSKVINFSECGYVIEYKNSVGLADLICQISNDDDMRSKLRNNALTYVKEYCSKTKTLKFILDKIKMLDDELK